jgi:L-lysine 2,3-aminomutase
MVPDHPELRLDSLDETANSTVPGLVHRYPDRALFLRESSVFIGYIFWFEGKSWPTSH